MLLFYSLLGRFRLHHSSVGEKGFGRKQPNGLPIPLTQNDEKPKNVIPAKPGNEVVPFLYPFVPDIKIGDNSEPVGAKQRG